MKLSAPLRVTWDWNWPAAVHPGRAPLAPDVESILVIGRELAKARVLLLEIGYPSLQSLSDGLVVRTVGGIGGQVSLVLSPEVLGGLPSPERLAETVGGGEVWVDVTPAASAPAEALPLSPDGSVWPNLRIYLTSSNCKEAAGIIGEAVQSGTRRISLPILPLFGSFLASPETQVPLWRDLVEFADFLEPIMMERKDLELRIHHQALWSLLVERGLNVTGDDAPGHSGCQAGGALAYIDPEGVLYPCSALPVPIGRVEKNGLSGIWKCAERSLLRKSIEEVPSVCDACSRWSSCRGGCRGWAYFLNGDFKEAGPDCGRGIEAQGLPQ